MSQYPPLKALVVFDSVMRSGSFSLAAEALCVTPGAVGQQIQKLEEWLGVALFIRLVRQVQPTEEARKYWQRIQPALVLIADTSQKVRASRKMAVSLSMPPTFAAKWFTRRMARLLTRHPELELHLNASMVAVDFERESIDLAVRYFAEPNPDLDATLLFKDSAHVYCAPDYARAYALETADDLVRATLLVTSMHPHWHEWLGAFGGIGDARMAAIPRIHFDQSLMAIEAAKQGQGAIMTSPLLIEAEINSGALIAPFQSFLSLASGYYVVHHSKLDLRPAAAVVKQWLIDEANDWSLQRVGS